MAVVLPAPSILRALRVVVTGLSIALALAVPAEALAAPGDWPTYHRDNFRSGNDTSASPVSAVTEQWRSINLDGAIYAEPLVVGNRVIVATEGDSIYSLDATTGAIVWHRNVGTPVNRTNPPFPCGNIDPIGITGTPVVDTTAGVVYAVAFEQPPSPVNPTYFLVGLNLADGTDHFAQVAIAPTGFDQFIQQQRSALALANGMVYVAFGGYAGDCGAYHGWVLGVPASGIGGQAVFQDQASLPPAQNAAEAGYWAASGPAVDAGGNVYLTSGNGSDSTTYDFGETVFKLSASLSLLDYWAPAAWDSMNQSDTDLGSAGPALVSAANNVIFQIGKSGWGYLVNSTAMSPAGNHIGSEPFSAQVCNAATSTTIARDQVFGGVAYADPFIYVPCPEGIKALKLAAGPSFTVAWSSSVSFAAAAPIVAGGTVWALDHNSGHLYGMDAGTGVVRFNIAVGSVTHFATPASAGGRVFVATGDQVVAFAQAVTVGPGRFHPLSPSRILDTRSPGGGGALGPAAMRDAQITGMGGVPSSGVAAVVMNVTVTNTTAAGYLTLYPTGAPQPLASNLNWVAGQTIPNLVEVAVGTGGRVTIFNAGGNTDVVLDVAGWSATAGAAAGPDGLYKPLVPSRILDTRMNPPSIGAGATRTLQVTNAGGVPATGAEAVVLNVTATNPSAGSYLTIYPAGASRPLASNLNFTAGKTVPNRVVVALGSGGQITIFNAAGSVDVIVDVGGWFTDASNAAATGSQFAGSTPARILDTRDGTGGFNAPVGANQMIAVTVAGVGGVPAMTSPNPPRAVVLNVTVTNPTAPSYLTVWPDGTSRPLASDLNFVANQIVPNLVIVQVGATGKIDIYNAGGSTNVIADVMGWYQ